MPIHLRSVSIAMRGKGSARREVPLDVALAKLAEEQFGVVGRRQLLGLGASEGWIERRLARGLLLRLHRGVYAVGHRLLDRRGRYLAAVLACEPGAVLSHRSAGELLGVLRPSSRLPEVTRPASWRQREGIAVHRSSIPDDEIEVVDGILTTGLSRTVLDLAARSSPAQVEQMLNEAEVLGLTTKVSLPTLLARYPRRAGNAAVWRVLRTQAETRGVTKRELERRFKAILDATDLPRPRRNAQIAVDGRFYEADCVWAEQRLIVELDGRAVHGTDRAFEHDRQKDRALMVDGWRVTRVTWLQLRDEAPAVVSDLRRMLAGAPL